MSGLFGGYLYLVELVGGFVLYILIGGKAWKKSDDGRFFRLALGALSIGGVLGAILGWTIVAKHDQWAATFWLGVFGALISCGLTAALNWIGRNLDD